MWRDRGSKKDLVYEDYNWEDPLILQFSSVEKNNPPDARQETPRRLEGILDLQKGDALEWECHEVNKQDTTLRFTNQTYDGAMCIIIGDLVGSKCVSRTGINIDPSTE